MKICEKTDCLKRENLRKDRLPEESLSHTSTLLDTNYKVNRTNLNFRTFLISFSVNTSSSPWVWMCVLFTLLDTSYKVNRTNLNFRTFLISFSVNTSSSPWVWMCERGRWGWGGCGLSSVISPVRSVVHSRRAEKYQDLGTTNLFSLLPAVVFPCRIIFFLGGSFFVFQGTCTNDEDACGGGDRCSIREGMSVYYCICVFILYICILILRAGAATCVK